MLICNTVIDEICSNGIDDDCDGTADDTSSTYGDCGKDSPCNDVDENNDGWPDDPKSSQRCDKCRLRGAAPRTDGEPVDLLNGEMYVGPNEYVRIDSGIDRAFDIKFAGTYDSAVVKRDYLDDAASTGSATQKPYIRTMGPGWRHNYDHRLILEGGSPGTFSPGPRTVVWDRPNGAVRFFQDYTARGTGHFKSEPGSNHRLVRPNNTNEWRLLTEDGDVLFFYEGAGSGTASHPWTATTGYHARLKFIHPRAIGGYRIVLHYEGDPETAAGDFAGTRPWGELNPPMPVGTCTGIITEIIGGAVTNVCDASRGLLVRVAPQLHSASQAYWSPGIELKYSRLGTSGFFKTEYIMRRVIASADRNDNVAVTTLARFVSTREAGNTARPNRTYYVNDGLACAEGATSFLCRKFHYDGGSSSGVLHSYLGIVYRSVMDASDAATVAREEEFAWSQTCGLSGQPSCPGGFAQYRVTSHASKQILLTNPTGGGQVPTTRSWDRNGEMLTMSFDAAGSPLACSDGQCGDPDFTKAYSMSAYPAFSKYALGPAHTRDRDGIDIFRQFNERGQVLFSCEVVASSAATPSCTINFGGTVTSGDAVTLSGGSIRRATRFYYNADGRLIAAAEITNELLTGSPAAVFPHDGTTTVGWFSTASTALPNCPNIAASFGSWTYDVTVYDANSNADTTLNALSHNYLGFSGDWAIVRTTRAAAADASGTIVSCEVTPRDDLGRVGGGTQEQQTRYQGVLVAQTERDFQPVFQSGVTVRARGRLKEVRHLPDVSAPASAVVAWRACATAADAYDREGRVTCVVVPQSPSDLEIRETSPALPTGSPYLNSRYRLTTYSSQATVQYRTYSVFSGSGIVLQSGVGNLDGASDNLDGNSFAYRYNTWAGNASVGPALVEVREIGKAGSLISKRSIAYTSIGFVQSSTVTDGAGSVRRKRQHNYPTPNPDGLAASIDDCRDASCASKVTTSFTYDQADDLLTLVEPDEQPSSPDTNGIIERHEKGLTATSTGRPWLLQRGTVSNPLEQRHITYRRRGEVQENAGISTAFVHAAYEYDAFLRLKKETLQGAGMSREIEYVDVSNPFRVSLLNAAGTPIRRIVYEHDDMGRRTAVCDGLGGNVSCPSPVWSFRYDTKGSEAKTSAYTAADGRAIWITDNNQKGRLAYETDASGTTFYEWDAMGRIVAVVRHTGALPVTSAATLSVTEYFWREDGALDKMRLPSGRYVQYTYGSNDRVRPSGVAASSGTGLNASVTTLLANVSYDVDGQPKSWTWGTGATSHVVTIDMLGRIEKIQDDYNTTLAGLWSEMIYSYEDDGDLKAALETVAPTAMMTATGAADAGVSYFYDSTRDMLDTWKFEGTIYNIDYASTARRNSEAAGLTFQYSYPTGTSGWERIVERQHSSALSSEEVYLGYNDLGEVVGIDDGNDGLPLGGGPRVYDKTLAYGVLGQVASANIPAAGGTWNYTYDAQMRRIRKLPPVGTSGERLWRYAVGREPIDELNVNTGTRSEFVFLGGQRVAAITSGGAGTTPGVGTFFNLHSDRMGVVRKAATTGGTMRARLIMSPWGKGVLCNGSTTSCGAVTSTTPSMSYRYAGQYEDQESGLIANGWRYLIPRTGTYTAPDPDHRQSILGLMDAPSVPAQRWRNDLPLGVDTSSAQRHALEVLPHARRMDGAQFASLGHYGPQAYSYAAARPFMNEDPTGRLIAPQPGDPGAQKLSCQDKCNVSFLWSVGWCSVFLPVEQCVDLYMPAWLECMKKCDTKPSCSY